MKIKSNKVAVLREVDRRIEKGLNEIASIVKVEAKRVVHVKTGKLQRSIDKEVFKRKAVIGSSVEYASFVEIAFPYLRLALWAKLNSIRRIFKVR